MRATSAVSFIMVLGALANDLVSRAWTSHGYVTRGSTLLIEPILSLKRENHSFVLHHGGKENLPLVCLCSMQVPPYVWLIFA
ncbi:hypothetical protein L2E82_20890 [Cichorium intybus]|uniref:Uncharacterized protein n=1 Tax=Cichorium intybus TaxID=13427 RepID=A0ACB9DUN8_CICIN|nr:hypothetical protein L2E82_20890 [Cichorium intybus]